MKFEDLALDIPTPRVISNKFVTLKPLTSKEAGRYFFIGQDVNIWNYLSAEPFQTIEDAELWVSKMLTRSTELGDIPFSVYNNATGRLAGSSSYLNVREKHAGLEIGYTWYGKAFQRTYVNTATKLVLFQNAFENLKCNRVQLQTDSRNQASQQAIQRLGATREGILRNHKIYPNGYVRDSVLYSVTIEDWPKIKKHLEQLLER